MYDADTRAVRTRTPLAELTEPGTGSDAAAPHRFRRCGPDPRPPARSCWTPYDRRPTGYSVADRVLQPHGGCPYLCEYGIEKIVRDLRVHRILEGTNEIMRVIVARGLTEWFG